MNAVVAALEGTERDTGLELTELQKRLTTPWADDASALKARLTTVRAHPETSHRRGSTAARLPPNAGADYHWSGSR